MFQQLKSPDLGITYTGGWCLQAVQNAFNTDHPYPTATAQWVAEKNKHFDKPPQGMAVPVFFSFTSEPAGHIAISLPDGRIASSTQSGTHRGLYIHPNLNDLMKVYKDAGWKMTYLGWGETVGTQQVIKGDDDMIQNNDSEYQRWNDLHEKIRNKTITRQFFNDNFVGKPERTILDGMRNDPEAVAVQSWQVIGKRAVTENWEEQIKNNQASRPSDSDAKLTAIREALGIK